MEQNASAAVIVSIVAVVLAALALIAGVVGYVQGSAALRRAILIRQRASAAEEAALQARAQAEQSARTAQQVLDRLNLLQLRSLTDVRDLPTGPLLLASRSPMGEPAPVPTAPQASVAAPTTEGPDGPLAPGPLATPAAERPAAERSATGPVEVPVAVGPPALTEAPPPAVAVRAADDAPSSDPASTAAPVPPARSASHAATRAEPAHAPSPAGQEPADEPPVASRSATGQVTAGLQDAPPMDWAEAIRTGAIPLPSVSRGTYAAPRKRSAADPAAPVRFELRAVGRQTFEAVNVGGVTAEQAAVEGTGGDQHLVRPVHTRATAVGPGEALAFSVLRVEGRRISVRVSWLREGGKPTSVELPLP